MLEIERGIEIDKTMLNLNDEEKEFWVKVAADMEKDKAAGYGLRFTPELPDPEVDRKRPKRYYEIANE